MDVIDGQRPARSHDQSPHAASRVLGFRLVQVFLETDRLTLRQFTADDVDNLVELDSDPDVMHYITGGRATPREEIEREELPHFLECYER